MKVIVLCALFIGACLASCGEYGLYYDNTVSVSIDGASPVIFTAGPNNGAHAGTPVLTSQGSDIRYLIASADPFDYDDFDIEREGFEVDFDGEIASGTVITYPGDPEPDTCNIFFCQVGGVLYNDDGASSGSVTIEGINETTGQVEGRLSGTILDMSSASHTIEVRFSVGMSSLNAYDADLPTPAPSMIR